MDRIIVARIKESKSHDTAAPAHAAAPVSASASASAAAAAPAAAASTRFLDGSAQPTKRARVATPTNRTFEIDFFDSESDFYAIKNENDRRLRDKNWKFVSEKKLEYACLILIDWLEKSSTDLDTVFKPEFETFFAPHLNARDYLSTEYGRTGSDLLDQFQDHLEALDPDEKHDYFVSRITRELECLFDPDSCPEVDPRPPSDFLSMYS